METIKVFSALLAPVVAIGAGWIAWQQYNLAQKKLKLDLYEKRYEIYKAVNDYIIELLDSSASAFVDNGPLMDSRGLVDFNLKTKQAQFLFEADVINYLDAFRTKANLFIKTHNCLKDQICYPQYSNERLGKIGEFKQISQWLQDELSTLEKHFEGYLSFRQIK